MKGADRTYFSAYARLINLGGMSGNHVRPKAVLFDLDGTLFDRDASFLELVRDQYDCFAAELERIPREVFVSRLVEMDGHGYVDRHAVYRDLARELCLPETTGERLAIHFRDAYASYSRCFPEVPSALAALRASGMKLGIITNGSTSMQEQKIRHLGLAGLMDEVLISEREKLRKPDRKIFERALERLRVVPAEAWYVGDQPLVDVQGAFEAGLTPVWRYTAHWQRPEVPAHEIHSLDELVRLLM
jgi:putative hydrolase of the HAD superfamily